jgi:NADPH:quinone reductase-like Zn-dependent oxidoreductase
VEPEPKAPPGGKVQSYDLEPSPQQLEKLNRPIESGPFEVHVAHTFPLDKAADAHRELDKHYLGKLALRPQ